MNKQCVYFPPGTLEEIRLEAKRLDRGISWVVQYAWKLSRESIKKLPPRTQAEGSEAQR
jgi:uncharacterized small protein (TIGR04563 family)